MNEHRYNGGFSHQGKPVIKGRVQPTVTTDDDHRQSDVDLAEHRFLEPTFDELLNDAVREVEEMRLNGRLRPFVEGEAIGAYREQPKPKPLTPAALRREHNERMQRRQANMLRMRWRNDAFLEG